MNMIIINYGEIPYLQFQKEPGQQIGIDTESPARTGVETYLGYGAPVLNTDNGGMGAWTGSYNSLSGDTYLGGDYLDIIYALQGVPGFPDNVLNLSIVFGLSNVA